MTGKGKKRPNYGMRVPRISHQGYRLVYCPEHPLAMSHGYVLEHRKVAWDAGKLTDRKLTVHHKNGDKLDNRVENLEVIRLSDHQSKHNQERGGVRNQHGFYPLKSLGGTPCVIDGCSDVSKTKKLCHSHYQRSLKYGTPTPDHLPVLINRAAT